MSDEQKHYITKYFQNVREKKTLEGWDIGPPFGYKTIKKVGQLEELLNVAVEKGAERAQLQQVLDTYPVRRVRDQMISTGRAIYRYEDRHRRWPKSLGELVPKYLSEAPIDPWGRELVYLVKPRRRGYVLGCYGANGRPGGEGEARDWYIEDGRFVRQPSVTLP